MALAGISIDSPGYGEVPGRAPRKKRRKEQSGWKPEETTWANLWLRTEPYVESTLCDRCFVLVRQLLQSYEGRDKPGWTPDPGGIAQLECKIWPDLVTSAIEGCHLCSLVVGSCWNAGAGPFDLFRWLRCEDRTGDLEVAVWDTYPADVVSTVQRAWGWALSGLQFGEELDFDAAYDMETAWSNIWLFQQGQPRAGRSPLGVDIIPDPQERPPRPMCLDTGGEEALLLARWWLRRCKSEHSACSSLDNEVMGLERPARLIYVGTDLDEELRLYPIMEPCAVPEYLALSYCWGKTQFKTLTSQTIDEYKRNIDYSVLPKTIQDAINVTRRLGYSYLWVDALCIIQNSKEDWATESVKMGQVYRHAVLTIAALGAQDSSRGCFLKRNPLCLRRCHIPGSDLRLSSTMWTMKREYQIRGNFASPLQTRAWVVQEEYSATRTLYFGSGGLWWQCLTCEASEGQPYGNLSQDDTGDGMPEGRFRTVIIPNGYAENVKYLIQQVLSDDSQSPAFHRRFTRLWGDILRRYTSCKLTYQSDKLVAISGIINLLVKRFGLEYKVGLWVSRLATELLWTSVTYLNKEIFPLKRAAAGAPTFSWASVEQPIQAFNRNPSVMLQAKSVELIDGIRDAPATEQSTMLKVVSQLKRVWLYPASPKDHNVISSLLVIAHDSDTGPPSRTELDTHDDGGGDLRYMVFTGRDKMEEPAAASKKNAESRKRVTYPWTPDIPVDEAPLEAWYLCLVSYEFEEVLDGTVGLIVVPSDSSRRRWSRIGIATHETLPLNIGRNVGTAVEDEAGELSGRLTARAHRGSPFLVKREKDFEEVIIV
jgi:hypothetical protein